MKTTLPILALAAAILTGCAGTQNGEEFAGGPQPASLGAAGKSISLPESENGFLGTGKSVTEHVLSLVKFNGSITDGKLCAEATVLGFGPELCIGIKRPKLPTQDEPEPLPPPTEAEVAVDQAIENFRTDITPEAIVTPATE